MQYQFINLFTHKCIKMNELRYIPVSIVQLDKLYRMNSPFINQYTNWLINKIGLTNKISFELINIIKQYCFISIKDKMIKQWKMHLINEIQHFEYQSYEHDNDEQLVRVLTYYDMINYTNQIESLFCIVCGNYSDRYRGNYRYHESCRCNC